MEEVKKNLRHDLECPVCMEYMLSPITLCENGHNICNACKPKLPHCPTCRGELTNVRNKSMEYLTYTFKFPCKNKEFGCTVDVTLGLNKDHEEECTYGPVKCPFTQTWSKCAWTGLQADLKIHLLSEHREKGYIRVMSQGRTNYSTFLKVIGPQNRRNWQQVVLTLDEVFFWYTHILDNTLYSCVQYVGPKTEASKYKYKLKFNSANNIDVIDFSHVCLSYDIDIYERIRNEDCVVLPYQSVQKFITNDKLLMDFEICAVTS